MVICMKKFTWSDEISVHVQEIDEQHKHFIDITNSIIELLEKETVSRQELIMKIAQLGDYAMVHFGTEEDYFNQFHYEDAVLHKAAHDQYRKQFKDLLDQARDENNDIMHIAEYVAKYAGDWLINHIKDMDQKFTKSFNEHGLR